MEIVRIECSSKNKGLFDIFKSEDWGTSQNYNILAARQNEDIRGILVFLDNSEDIRIIYLYVFPQYRRQGIATMLLDNLELFLQTTGISKPLTMSFEENPEREAFLLFLNNRGNYILDNYSEYISVTPEQRQKSDYYRELNIKSQKVVPLFSLGKIMRKQFLTEIMEQPLSISDYILSDGDEFIDELSLCYADKEKIQSLCLISLVDNSNLEIAYLYGSNSKSLIFLLSAIKEIIETKYSEYVLNMVAINNSSHKLAEHMWNGGYNKKNLIYAIWNGMTPLEEASLLDEKTAFEELYLFAGEELNYGFKQTNQ